MHAADKDGQTFIVPQLKVELLSLPDVILCQFLRVSQSALANTFEVCQLLPGIKFGVDDEQEILDTIL
jgi:hypothetical protein